MFAVFAVLFAPEDDIFVDAVRAEGALTLYWLGRLVLASPFLAPALGFLVSQVVRRVQMSVPAG